MKNLVINLLVAVFLVLNYDASAQKVVVLGTAQDGGFPHIGCQKECQLAYENPVMKRYVVSLALVDEQSQQWWLFEATPDIRDQLQLFQELTGGRFDYLPNGIFLTHAHMGHYTGLMQLGREALGADRVPVYSLPKMKSFLENNGPWSQLVDLENISMVQLDTNESLILNENISIQTYRVPHRDEFSETAGFEIRTNDKNYLFIPDINKWELWEESILDKVSQVDIAFLDASFLANGEIPNRDMSEIPHPFVTETMELFEKESTALKSKVHFIHFNHTNPLLWDQKTIDQVKDAGFNVTEQGEIY